MTKKEAIMWGLILSGVTALLSVFSKKQGTNNNDVITTVTETIKSTPSVLTFATLGNPADIDVLARTLYGEARGESYKGKQAVANVIVNRYKEGKNNSGKRRMWGDSIANVCLKPWQFSCWNKSDPNRDIIINIKPDANTNIKECFEIARLAVSGKLPDITNGATYYHTTAVYPAWSRGKEPDLQIATHVFFKTDTIG